MNSKHYNRASAHFRRTALAVAAISALLIGLVFAIPAYMQPQDQAVEAPISLRIGVLPDQSSESLKQRLAPLLSYLSDYLGMPCELTVPASYQELLQLFHDGKVDLAYFGGYSYVRARQADQAIPLVMRRVDTRFTSLFIVNGGSTARSIEDLRGKRIAFGSRLSTSGHLMPRYFLQQNDMVPESFFGAVLYSGAHDTTAYWVRDGKVDVGAANATTVRSLMDRNIIGANELRILWETPPYPDYVWAIRPRFGDAFNSKIRDAFLGLSPDEASHAVVLQGLDAVGYVPADPDYFLPLKQIARETDSLLTPENDN